MRKFFENKLGYYTLAILVLFLLVAIKISFSMYLLSSFKKEKCPQKYEYISLDLNCDGDSSSHTLAIKESVQDVIDVNLSLKNASRISVFYRDLDNRQWFGVNENDTFSPASLLKLPLAIAYYKLAEVDSSVLTQSREYRIADLGDADKVQNVKSEKTLSSGETYSINDLIKYMIQASDNNAMVILSNSINQKFLENVGIDLGIVIPLGSGLEQEFVSVKTYAGIMRALFNASYLNQKFSNELLESMSKSEFKQGIVAGVPTNIKVANKFGERGLFSTSDSKMISFELHDCGIVYAPEKPYILCVMTQGKDYEKLTKVIADISKDVYENR